jgi:hypothetical protein
MRGTMIESCERWRFATGIGSNEELAQTSFSESCAAVIEYSHDGIYVMDNLKVKILFARA